MKTSSPSFESLKGFVVESEYASEVQTAFCEQGYANKVSFSFDSLSIQMTSQVVDRRGVEIVLCASVVPIEARKVGWKFGSLLAASTLQLAGTEGFWYRASEEELVMPLDMLAIRSRPSLRLASLTGAGEQMRLRKMLWSDSELLSRVNALKGPNPDPSSVSSHELRLTEITRRKWPFRCQIGGFPESDIFLPGVRCIDCLGIMKFIFVVPNLSSNGERWFKNAGVNRLFVYGCDHCGTLFSRVM